MKARTTVYLSHTEEEVDTVGSALPTTLGPKAVWRCEKSERVSGIVRSVFSASNEELTPSQREAAKEFQTKPSDWVEPDIEDETPTTDLRVSNYTEEDGNRLLVLRRQHGIKT